MDIPNAGHIHAHALDAFKQKHDKTLRELMNHIYEQAKAGKFNLTVHTLDRDEIDCILVLADYGYKVICEPSSSQTNEYVYKISW